VTPFGVIGVRASTRGSRVKRKGRGIPIEMKSEGWKGEELFFKRKGEKG
jgi:hypothetical protein